MPTGPMTRGLHHLGLAVPDLEAARDFFVTALGFSLVGGVDAYPAVFVSDGTTLLTLWRVEDPATATPFDRRRNVGLHHFALAVPDLDGVRARLRDFPGFTIEFEPQAVGHGFAVRHFMGTIPGGLRIEFFEAPAA